MVKGKMSTNLGDVIIEPEVVAQYAGIEAMECFGVVGMAAVSMKDGLVKLLKMESLTKGINVVVRENRIFIDFHIIIAYGVSALTVSENLRENVKYKVEEYTGLPVARINIYIEGVRVID